MIALTSVEKDRDGILLRNAISLHLSLLQCIKKFHFNH